MQLTEQKFQQNLLAAASKVIQKTSSGNRLAFSIVPIYEINAKYNSTDDYLRMTLLNKKNIEGRLFNSQEAAAFLTGPKSLFPLWIDIALKEQYEGYCLIELKISMRFRKPSELNNKETGHPPFRVV